MKEYNFPLDRLLLATVAIPIREKRDIVFILMGSIKIMLMNQQIPSEQRVGYLTLFVNKMSRLFVAFDNKIFSIHFPFFVDEIDSTLKFYNHYIDDIDQRLTSDILGLIKSRNTFDGDCIYNFFESVDEIKHYGQSFWGFLRELFLFEPGYIRYDYDEERQNGRTHPLNHYDLFYSSNTTFKIGLNNRIEMSKMIELLDTETDCHYLRPPLREA